MPLTYWDTEQDVARFLDGGGEGIVFKHSTRCQISGAVREQVWEPFQADHPDIPCFEVLVVEHRPASKLIAERLGVTHQSPQAIVVRGGRATWNESHMRISVDQLVEAWAGP